MDGVPVGGGWDLFDQDRGAVGVLEIAPGRVEAAGVAGRIVGQPRDRGGGRGGRVAAQKHADAAGKPRCCAGQLRSGGETYDRRGRVVTALLAG